MIKLKVGDILIECVTYRPKNVYRITGFDGDQHVNVDLLSDTAKYIHHAWFLMSDLQYRLLYPNDMTLVSDEKEILAILLAI